MSDEMDFALEDLFEEAVPVAVEEGVATVRVTLAGGSARNVQWAEGMTVAQALELTGAMVPPGTTNLWVNGAPAGMDTTLDVGATIMTAGKVAGG